MLALSRQCASLWPELATDWSLAQNRIVILPIGSRIRNLHVCLHCSITKNDLKRRESEENSVIQCSSSWAATMGTEAS